MHETAQGETESGCHTCAAGRRHRAVFRVMRAIDPDSTNIRPDSHRRQPIASQSPTPFTTEPRRPQSGIERYRAIHHEGHEGLQSQRGIGAIFFVPFVSFVPSWWIFWGGGWAGLRAPLWSLWLRGEWAEAKGIARRERRQPSASGKAEPPVRR